MTETIVKIGGSLCRSRMVLKRLCRVLNEFNDIFVVPGGGEFAERIRWIDREFGLGPEVAHNLAILAMQQTGVLIRDFFKGEIIDCSTLLGDRDLKASWDVTSDSIAAYVAKKRGAERLILLKEVDGVFTADPKKNKDASLISGLTVEELSEMENSCVDKEFPGFVRDSTLDIWIVNGGYPERIKKIMDGKKARGTRIFIHE